MTLLQTLREMERNGVTVKEMAKRMRISEHVVRNLLKSAA